MDYNMKFTFKVAGLTFDNRSENLRGVHTSDSVNLIPEPSNKYHIYAIRINKKRR